MFISLVMTSIIFLISVLVLKPAAESWGLVDSPSSRKQHSGNIPLIGGIAIYFATLTVVTFYIKNNQHINLLIISISLMVFIGMLDDKYDLSAKLRLVAQVLIASILVFGTGIHLENFGNLLGTGEINIGPFSGVVTILAIVAGINAFNMTDGIDGLAGSLGLISLLAVSVVISEESFRWFIWILSMALIMFLLFNLGFFTRKNKIFMGDAGSMMLGLTISWLLVVFSQAKGSGIVAIKPALALWFVAVPLIDMIAVMYRRIRKGKSPLKADREHLHHIFMDIGLSSVQALIFITILSASFAVFGIVLNIYDVPDYISLILFALALIIYNIMLTNRFKIKLIIQKLVSL